MKFFLVALGVLSISSAAAAQVDPRNNVRQACSADAQRLCPDREGRSQCMRAHQADLSQSCKDALAAAHLKAKEIKPAG